METTGIQWRLQGYSGDYRDIGVAEGIQWRLQGYSGDCRDAVETAGMQWRQQGCSGDYRDTRSKGDSLYQDTIKPYGY